MPCMPRQSFYSGNAVQLVSSVIDTYTFLTRVLVGKYIVKVQRMAFPSRIQSIFNNRSHILQRTPPMPRGQQSGVQVLALLDSIWFQRMEQLA